MTSLELLKEIEAWLSFNTEPSKEETAKLRKSIKEHEAEQLRLGAVSKRFFVCEDINHLNEMKVISVELDEYLDAKGLKETMKEGYNYKDKSLVIINVY